MLRISLRNVRDTNVHPDDLVDCGKTASEFAHTYIMQTNIHLHKRRNRVVKPAKKDR
jgi:hypothetical protein